MESNDGIQDARDKEMCAIALDEAFGLCGNNTVIFEQIAVIMGIRKGDLASVTPLESKYRGVLASGPSQGDKWVIARAWDLVVNDKLGIMDAFTQAWDEATPEPQVEPEPQRFEQAGPSEDLDLDEFPEDP